MRIGLVGLGKMGANMRTRLRTQGVEVVGFDRNPDVSDVATLEELVTSLPAGERFVWVMVPAGDPTRDVLARLTALLVPGDAIIEGGNTHYVEDAERAAALAEHGIDIKYSCLMLSFANLCAARKKRLKCEIRCDLNLGKRK